MKPFIKISIGNISRKIFFYLDNWGTQMDVLLRYAILISKREKTVTRQWCIITITISFVSYQTSLVWRPWTPHVHKHNAVFCLRNCEGVFFNLEFRLFLFLYKKSMSNFPQNQNLQKTHNRIVRNVNIHVVVKQLHAILWNTFRCHWLPDAVVDTAAELNRKWNSRRKRP